MTLSKKKSAVKKAVLRPISKEKSMIVQPVQLPIATEKKKKKLSKKCGMLLLLILAALIWGWLIFEVVMILHPVKSCDIPPMKVQVPVVNEVTQPVQATEPQYAENVVAVVGDEEITIEEVQEFVKQVPQLAEIPFEQVYPKMLDMYINNKVVMMGAEEMMLPQDPEVQRMIQMAEEQILTQAFLTNALEQTLTEQDLKDYYQEEVKKFQPQEEIHGRHILVDTQEQANNVVIQLKAGADFAALANQKSLDKNAKDGDLGYFTREMMIPEFAEAVFKMEKGELSEPVRTAYGWHVIQVMDKRMTTPPKFEDVKGQLRQVVMEKKVPEILKEEWTKRNVKVLRPKMN